MHLLLIAAALSNQLWFETQQQDDALVVTPMATLTDDCNCQMTINVIHQGNRAEQQQPERQCGYKRAAPAAASQHDAGYPPRRMDANHRHLKR
ncbi:hypothetical protein CEW81_14655 [Kluyvera genomosp. 3]|uniref:Curli assembly protein CsgC n=1 Tax=Kluyvera genomosp. 3 TaxID=2774055 RepID=A0A248KJB0_9ENTR|nr:hypothetical protein CEW81_14655 [Kluyvera genomosp. 3]